MIPLTTWGSLPYKPHKGWLLSMLVIVLPLPPSSPPSLSGSDLPPSASQRISDQNSISIYFPLKQRWQESPLPRPFPWNMLFPHWFQFMWELPGMWGTCTSPPPTTALKSCPSGDPLLLSGCSHSDDHRRNWVSPKWMSHAKLFLCSIQRKPIELAVLSKDVIARGCRDRKGMCHRLLHCSVKCTGNFSV